MDQVIIMVMEADIPPPNPAAMAMVAATMEAMEAVMAAIEETGAVLDMVAMGIDRDMAMGMDKDISNDMDKAKKGTK